MLLQLIDRIDDAALDPARWTACLEHSGAGIARERDVTSLLFLTRRIAQEPHRREDAKLVRLLLPHFVVTHPGDDTGRSAEVAVRKGVFMSDCDCPSLAAPDPEQAGMVQAHREATRRDPRGHPFGYLAGDPWTGALGPLLWFASPGAMFDFLIGPEVGLLRFDERDTVRIRASLRRAIGATRDVGRLDRGALSAAFEGWSEIVWIGTFADLCSRGGDVQTGLRRAFRADHALGDHAGPIADDEVERFVVWLAG